MAKRESRGSASWTKLRARLKVIRTFTTDLHTDPFKNEQTIQQVGIHSGLSFCIFFINTFLFFIHLFNSSFLTKFLHFYKSPLLEQVCVGGVLAPLTWHG